VSTRRYSHRPGADGLMREAILLILSRVADTVRESIVYVVLSGKLENVPLLMYDVFCGLKLKKTQNKCSGANVSL